MTQEHRRLQESHEGKLAWKKWGPYLSERQWGTVREDYSSNGDAWNYFVTFALVCGIDSKQRRVMDREKLNK